MHGYHTIKNTAHSSPHRFCHQRPQCTHTGRSGPVTEFLITTKFTAIHCNCSWEPPLLLRIHYHDANGHHRTNYHRCMGTTLPKIPPTLLHTDSATGDLSAPIRDVPCVPVTELLITTKFTAIHCNCSWEPPLLLRIHYHDANGHHRTNYHRCMGTTLSKIPR